MEVLALPEFIHLRVHIPLYKSLGVDGMSSDEEVVASRRPGGRATILSFRKAYLSEEVSKLNIHIDQIHEKRLGPTGFYNPAPRIPKACIQWITKLPSNVYDAAAKQQLTDQQIRQVQMEPKPHPFVYHTGRL